jgi:hypothetical protein
MIALALISVLFGGSPLLTTDVLTRAKKCADSVCKFDTKLGLAFEIEGVGKPVQTVTVTSADSRAGLYLSIETSGCIVVRPGADVSLGDAAIRIASAEIFNTATACHAALRGQSPSPVAPK